MKSDLQAAFSLSAMKPQNKNSMTTLTGKYFRLCSRAHSDENKMLLVEFFLRSLGAERCTYARDLDLEGAHAFAHHSFEVYLQPSKAAWASKMTLREPTKKTRHFDRSSMGDSEQLSENGLSVRDAEFSRSPTD
jgi:hypothetical protein